jgi:hypothetical protein
LLCERATPILYLRLPAALIFDQLEKPMNTTTDVTLNRASLSEYDIIFALDRSGSMGSPSARFPGKSLWQEAEEFTQGLANFADTVDDDGLDLVLFGTDVSVHNGLSGADVHAFFEKETPRGTTNLADALAEVVKMQKASGKNTICIVVTDGAPNDRGKPIDILQNASNNLTSREQLNFQFVQIGRDQSAAEYLDRLDDDLVCKFDIVDALPAAVAETMDPVQLLEKAIND